MYRETIPDRRLTAWMTVAVSAPLAAFAGKAQWLPVLLSAAACGIVSFLVLRFCDSGTVVNPVLCTGECLWLGILLGQLAVCVTDCWETESPLIPAVLLLLAAFSAKNASRAGAVLIWLAVPVFGLVLGAGASELRFQWLTPRWETPRPELLLIFLLPCAAVFLNREKGKLPWLLPAIVGFSALLLSVWIRGSLTPETESSLYEYSKGISLFGITERFDSLLSCTLTAGWFALFGVLLSAAGCLAERIRSGWGQRGVWYCAGLAIAVLISGIRLTGSVVLIVSVLLWAAVPLLARFNAQTKKSKKSKNNT
ncbi:MAG: hypothetical protein PUB93_06450 [Firmicutes bacterium]|nr:hypothetical protein [Bacillota bacterium]